MHKLLTDLRLHPAVASCFSFGDTLHAMLNNNELTTTALTSWLSEKGHQNVTIVPIEPNVEDCFMELTK
jgi:hypothetical protein